MPNLFVISDTHFNHKNILSFTHDGTDQKIRPGFDSLEDMNETMIENWNSVVKPQDKIYHLGDVFFGSNDEADILLSRLNGHKRLVLGNHDDPHKFPVLMKYFEKIMVWRVFKEDKLLFTHIPIHPSNLIVGLGEHADDWGQRAKAGMTNIHGHIHQNPSPDGPYKNVCVEQTNYYPVSIEELK